MGTTIVIQSYRTHDVPPWLARCLASVRAWAAECGFTYRFLGDELFDPLPARLRLRAGHLPQMLADLGRLHAIAAALVEGADRAVWVDADVFVFGALRLPDAREHYLCHEVWIEPGIAEDRVNNCVCSFTAASSLLACYRDSCMQIIDAASGALDSLALGTRFLTGLDRLVTLPKYEAIGLTSPHVLRELADTGALPDLLRTRHREPIAALNLCASFRGKTIRGTPSIVVDDALYESAMARLESR